MFMRVTKVKVLDGINKPNNVFSNPKQNLFTFRTQFFTQSISKRATSLSFLTPVKNSPFSLKLYSKNHFLQSALIKHQQRDLSSLSQSKDENLAGNVVHIIKNEDERNNNNEQKTDWVVILWLAGCTLLVFGIILIGGITRLTESGLSMTDWEFHGGLPPMTQEEWVEEFEKYKKFPEFER